MKAPKFSYVRASTIAEALTLIDRHGADARILAGGQSLMPTLNMRLSQPAMLIDINRLDTLKGISIASNIVRFGALARHVEVMNSPIVAQHLPLIAEAMPHVAHLAVRNRGTFGGSIALADPAAEMPACALALQASIVVESVKAGIACTARFEGDVIAAMRLVYFGSEGRPTVARGAIAALQGKAWSDAHIEAACAALAADLAPMKSLESEPAMLLHLQRVLTRRTLTTVRERSQAK